RELEPELLVLGAHAITPLPSGCSGQDRRTGHMGHRSLVCAANRAAAMVSAAPSTSAPAQLEPSGSGARAGCSRSDARTVSVPTYTRRAPALRVPSGRPGPSPSGERRAPLSTASWYAPSWGCSAAFATVGALRPVLRSATIAAPSPALSTRSILPRSRARPT